MYYPSKSACGQYDKLTDNAAPSLANPDFNTRTQQRIIRKQRVTQELVSKRERSNIVFEIIEQVIEQLDNQRGRNKPH